MFPLAESWGTENKQSLINSLFHSRLRLAVCALFVQMLAFALIIRPFIFTSLFNIPAILALLQCTNKRNLCDYKTQKNIKLLLKIGIAKAVGGFLLAIYMGLKYAYMPISGISSNYQYKEDNHLKLYALYFTAGALIDIVYSFLARDAIKCTKEIIIILKGKRERVNSPKSSSFKQVKMPGAICQSQDSSNMNCIEKC